ncbi:hypothetical protein CHLNCDRAFT_139630 [Chlorella variabilis]|uniref:Uncharacterized protein n=1 Tax=Chlorella variabilis TaxID=554065 RepID=E1ZQK5_CHLVA|nr:hypothetical protein CHLNCDRAFT_139630 [Chlorella variabilis]EFN51956.1 hypothetical protein CHLNCDRAFT_139630 [Chlorella variabilis]|eukprot:XP_005844058.1 hypothetical protein CHLNCDRAFT_139630 [Chlorella variabilis]
MWCTPRLGPGPFQLELVSEKLIKPPAVSSARTELACLDQVNVITCTTRAWGWQGGRLDAAALEAALRATVTDLPFLAGRICKMEGGRLGSLHIEHSGAGALLTVATSEDARVAGMGPLTWPQPRITLAAPAIPFYIPPMDGRRVMAGKEPLMKVQLSQLADGDVLGITLSHLVCDGVRWPLLAAHLAARYRERVGGPPADPAHLLRPVDRCLMSSGAMAAQLGCEGGEWREHRLEVRPSLGGYWRLAKLLVADGLQPMQLLVLHIPAQQATGAGAPPAARAPVSTTKGARPAAAPPPSSTSLGTKVPSRPLTPAGWRRPRARNSGAPPSAGGGRDGDRAVGSR